MSQSTVPCIVCGKALENVFEDSENQPSEGCVFSSHGQFGSRVWDPMDGQYLEVNICDECLVKKANEGCVLQGRDRRPVIASKTLVGWEHVQRAFVPWDGKRGTDTDDVVNIADDEVGDENLTKTAEGRTRIEWLE